MDKEKVIPKTGGELMAKYPKIFRQKDLPMQETCMCWGVCADEGWLLLLNNLCSTLQFNTDVNGYPQVEATQVKEKYATLRFYWEVARDWKPTKKWRQDPSFWERLANAWDYVFYGKPIRNEVEYDCGYIHGMIQGYEAWSAHTCEICGEKGEICSRGGWLKTLCPKHASELEYKPDDYEEEEEGPKPVPEKEEKKEACPSG